MTFKEIMNNTGQQERGLVIAAIISDGVAPSTAYAWCSGARRPRLLYQMQIQKHVKRILGLSVPLAEMFPEK